MSRRILIALAVLLSLAHVPAAAQGSPDPAAAPPARITVIQVRRACAVVDLFARHVLKDICALQVPAGDLRDPAQWQDWERALGNASAAQEIRKLGGDPSELRIRDILPALADSLTPLLAADLAIFDARALRVALARAETSARAARVDTALGLLPDSIRGSFAARRAQIGVEGQQDKLADLFKEILPRLDRAALARLVEGLPPKSLMSALPRDSDLTFGATASGSGPGRVALMMQGAQAQVVANTPALSATHQSSLLWGTTDFVMSRAELQIQTFALRRLEGRLCNGLDTMVLVASCTVLNPERLRITRPGLGLLRDAVVQDMQALPYAIPRWALERAGGESHPLRDELHTVAALMEFVMQTAQGEDPWIAFANLAGPGSMEMIGDAGTPASSALISVAALLATRVDPSGLRQITLEGAEDLLRDQMIAVAAMLAERAPRTAVAPWRYASLAVLLEDRIEDLREHRTALRAASDTLQAGVPRLRAARRDFVQAVYLTADTLLYEASRLPGAANLVKAQVTVAATREIVLPLLEHDFSRSLLALERLFRPYLDGLPSTDTHDWARALTFVSEVSAAQSAEHVSAALASMVDPGGYEAKRKARRARVSVNAFIGAHGAPRIAGFSGEGADGSPSAYVGPYLPLGVALTVPRVLNPVPASWGRLGVFGQALDLGALASWRLGNDSGVSDAPQVTAAQVFSPGIFLVLDVAHAPLTVGYGFSVAPDLRKVGTDDQYADATRTGFFVALDVPLFP